uniref:Uncharacterized protein n=1 Tax=Hyaloperonospora arabidopsidis (strain Emoy2) TaxID=559515 RepID=M4B554_HYAAE
MEESVDYGSDTSVSGDSRTMACCSMSNRSWLFNEKKALSAMRKWSQPLGTSVTMCSLHPVWRNVYVKRLAKRWQRGPLVL